jgi:hypothetical protein
MKQRNTYHLLRFVDPSQQGNIIQIGTATSTSAGHLVDSNGTFATAPNDVVSGDVVYNLTDHTYAIVTSSDTITGISAPLSADIFTSGEDYIIVRTNPRGLFTYLDASSHVVGTLLDLRDGSTISAAFNIYNGSVANSPHVVADGNGGAFVIYRIGTNIYGKRVGGSGTLDIGSPSTNVGVLTGTGAIRDVQTVTSPATIQRVFVLYENGGNVYLTERNAALGSVFSVLLGAGSGSVLALDHSGDPNPIVAYVNASNDIVVTRRNFTTGANVTTYTIPTGTNAYWPATTILSLSIAPGGNGGCVVSWIDDRYYANMGLSAFTQSFSAAMVPEQDSDSSAATDYTGIPMGIVNSDDNDYAWVGTTGL